MAYKMAVYKITAGCRTRAQILAKIASIDAIIDALLTTALTQVESGNIFQYKLDTGQSKTDVTYRSSEEVMAGVEKYEKLRQFYMNKLSPRMTRLVDSKNFNR